MKLLEYTGDGFARVNRAWEGRTVAIIAGGPSFKPEWMTRIATHDWRVIAVNNSYTIAPAAEVVFFADKRWYEVHKSALATHTGFKVTIDANKRGSAGQTLLPEPVYTLRRGKDFGLSDRPDTLHTGSNGGYMALNFACLAGAKRVLLFGFDMKSTKQKTHWHKGHPWQHSLSVYKQLMLPKFKSAALDCEKLGVVVENVSTDTALRVFPIVEPEKILNET